MGFLIWPSCYSHAQSHYPAISIDLFSERMFIPCPNNFLVDFNDELSKESIFRFYKEVNGSDYLPTVSKLMAYKNQKELNDWFYYQLIRRTAQMIAPKEVNYNRYTLYKWFLMVKSGFDAKLALHNQQLLFYIRSEDEVFSIPLFEKNGKQYVCLNIHDFFRANHDFNAIIDLVEIEDSLAVHSFSYAVSNVPDFAISDYEAKDILFPYGDKEYHFQVKINQKLGQFYANYPIVGFESYFNIPLSKTTYQSLIPTLKRELTKVKTKEGVDYLMKFTRNAFLYEDDQVHFGKEKRMPPEETLLSEASDCDDRAALFFYLVKEIYKLPMIVVLYENHVTVAVQFKKRYGKTITYQGKQYTLCEPTPQGSDLSIGQIAEKYKNKTFEIVYSYNPNQ